MIGLFWPDRKNGEGETAQSNDVKVHGTTPNLTIRLWEKTKTKYNSW